MADDNWNEREHPRHLRGNSKGGRFRRARGGWAQQVSDAISGEGPLGPIWPPPTPYAKRGTRGGFAIWPGEMVADDRRGVAEIPIDQIGRDRGDGTREATSAELAGVAIQLPGRIEFLLSDGQWLPVTSVVNGENLQDKTPRIQLGSDNIKTAFLPESVIVFKEKGKVTDEDRFFEMRLALGGESNEPALPVVRHAGRYIGKVEVQDPETGRWSVLRYADEFPDVDVDDDEFSPLEFGTDAGRFYIYDQSGGLSENGVYGTIRIRPISG